jgi:hypothetical protein
MHSEPSPLGYGESLVILGDECLRIDHSARLEQGCTVAVFWDGSLVMVGRLARRPVPHRHFVIELSDANGKVRRSRQLGPRDEEVKAYRVVGRGRVVPI